MKVKKKKQPKEDVKSFIFTAENIQEIIQRQANGELGIPRHMNPWYKNDSGVRRKGVIYGWTQDEINEHVNCVLDVNHFANNYCKIKTEDGQTKQMSLRDYQYDVLNTYTKNSRVINMSSRQSGKCLTSDTLICISYDNGITNEILSFKELINRYNIKFNIEDIPIYNGNELNKIWFIKNINNIMVLTITGWTNVNELNITSRMFTIIITTESGAILEGADLHLIMSKDGWKSLDELNINDSVIVGNKFEKIIKKEICNDLKELYDLSTENGDYLTTKNILNNDINIKSFINFSFLSHNTVTAAITILQYIIANSNKNVMIVANKAETVIEIIDKIKNIYKLLPFFLKPGIVNWNTRTIVFDNGCRIKSAARTKEPAIGFTIDFLYMDEFAHIPNTIVRHYYKAVVPTVSSIKNSKIIITSTPNGSNLFKELVVASELPANNPDKGPYKVIRVYWWQVPDGEFEDKTRGTRLDPKLYVNQFELDNYKLNTPGVQKILNDLGFKTQIETETTDDIDKKFIRILYEKDKTDIDIIRQLKINNVDISLLFNITNWKENETKLIGGEENFNQEYNLQFIAGSRRILSAVKTKELEERRTQYKNLDIDILTKRLRFTLNELKFAPDFIEQERNKYYWVSAVDVGEGLGLDYSVINNFRLMVRPIEWLQQNKIKQMYDAFYLKQTFIYHHNKLDHRTEFPEIFYMLNYEFLNPERVKAILEINNCGGTFLASIPNIFGGNHNYGSHTFVRFKHNQRDVARKIGLRVSADKKDKVKSYIDAMEIDKIYIDEDMTLGETENFVKMETKGGGTTYKADSGNDDIQMTIVNLSSIFETQDWKNMCISYYNELSQETQNLIDKALDLQYNSDAASYKHVAKVLAKNKLKTVQNNRFNNITNKL